MALYLVAFIFNSLLKSTLPFSYTDAMLSTPLFLSLSFSLFLTLSLSVSLELVPAVARSRVKSL